MLSAFPFPITCTVFSRKISDLKFYYVASVFQVHGACSDLTIFFFSPWRNSPPSPLGQGLLIFEASRWHSDTSQWVGLLWMSDRPDAETCTWRHTTLTRVKYSCPRRDSSGRKPTPYTAQPLGSCVMLLLLLVMSSILNKSLYCCYQLWQSAICLAMRLSWFLHWGS